MNHNAPENNVVHFKSDALPTDKAQAINILIRVTQGLVNMADREAQALAQNDLTTLAILQDEKVAMTELYAQMGAEFREKIHLYHGADKNLVNRLEKLQIELGEIARSNNEVVGTIAARSRANTQSSLLAAQEIAQNVRITYPEKTSSQAQG